MGVSRHNSSLYSVTDDVKVAQGVATFTGKGGTDYATTRSSGKYVVTLTEPHTYKVQHHTLSAKTTNGLGLESRSGVSIFTTVDIEKVGTGGASSGGGGVIKQVKQFRKTDTFESSSALPSTTKVTGLTATITPKSKNSKIMVMVTGAVGVSANNYGTAIQLYRGAEQINLAEIRGTETNAIMGTPVSGEGWSESFSVNYLDSPSTTDEVSYELYLGAEDGATAMLGGTVSSTATSSASVPTNIILMEVGEDSGGGSGSGGGSYTPEKFEWSEDLIASGQRAFDTEYTNTNDVPLYLQAYVNATGNNGYVTVLIDGTSQGSVGIGTGSGNNVLTIPLTIVPSGSTYKIAKTGTITQPTWKEARMPVAVGTGGKPVAFDVRMEATKSTPNRVDTLLPLDVAEIDTENGLKDGAYEVQKSGTYQITYSTQANGGVSGLASAILRLLVNDVEESIVKNAFNNYYGYQSSLSKTVLLDLKVGDTLKLQAFLIEGSGANMNCGGGGQTSIVGVLLSGATASGGDSIWSDVDGDAVLETDGKKLTVDANVAELGAKARITTDTGILELKVGSGDLADMVLTDSELTVHDKKVTTEAPIDGKQYARKDGDWSEVTGGGGASTTFNGVKSHSFSPGTSSWSDNQTHAFNGKPGSWKTMGKGPSYNSTQTYFLIIRIS